LNCFCSKINGKRELHRGTLKRLFINMPSNNRRFNDSKEIATK
jgi:hypothetical protein